MSVNTNPRPLLQRHPSLSWQLLQTFQLIWCAEQTDCMLCDFFCPSVCNWAFYTTVWWLGGWRPSEVNMGPGHWGPAGRQRSSLESTFILTTSSSFFSLSLPDLLSPPILTSSLSIFFFTTATLDMQNPLEFIIEPFSPVKRPTPRVVWLLLSLFMPELQHQRIQLSMPAFTAG